MTSLTMQTATLNLQSIIQFILDSIVKFILGVFLCINPLTAPLVMGWLLGYMRNKSIQVLVKKSADKPVCFGYKGLENKHILYWPNWSWVSNEDGCENKKSRIRRFVGHYFGAVKHHYKNGLLAILNMWLLTFPLCLLWLLMWNTGHDMNFNKSYEEIGLPVFTSFASILCFSFLMMYLPIAQARQALHDNWRRFFDFKVIMRIARQVRFRLLFMAMLYGLGSIGLILMTKVLVADFEAIYGLDMEDTKAVKDAVFGHYMMIAFFFFAGIVFLKRMSAKIYAIGLLKALRKGALDEDSLTPLEYDFLITRLGNKEQPEIESRKVIKILKWPVKHALNIFIILSTLVVWCGFVFTIYIGQFTNNNMLDWLLHPLVHMPYIYIPRI